MASWKPEIYDAEEVAAYYENGDAVTYRVYVGTKPDPAYLRYAFEEKDKSMKQEGANILRAALQKILSNKENTNPYLLEIVTGSTGRAKKEITTNITFQLNKVPAFGRIGDASSVDPALVQVLKGIAEQNALILSKLSAEEAEEVEGVGGVASNPIMGMLERPEIMNVLSGALAGVLQRFLKLPGTSAAAPAADNLMISNLAGMGNAINDKQINDAVEILKKHDPEIGTSLMKLAQLAETNPGYFQQLIGMLKTM